jgi:hypothetical protein
MTKHQKLVAQYEALTGAAAPAGTSTMALQVLVNRVERAAATESFKQFMQQGYSVKHALKMAGL